MGYGDARDIGYTQWTLIDFENIERSPDSEAMRKVEETMPDQTELGPNEMEKYRVIFTAEYTDDLEWVVEPFAGAEAATVRIVTN